MRASWLLIGVAGAGGLSAGAAQGAFSFQTVLDDNQPIPALGGATGPYFLDNFVVGQGGVVAASIWADNGYLVYGAAGSGLSAVASLGADEGQWAGGAPSIAHFSSFNTLSLDAANRLTFGAMNDAGGTGLYQSTGGTLPQRTRIVASPSSAESFDATNANPLTIALNHQVNGAGQVAVSAYTTGGSATDYALRGSAGGVQVAAKSSATDSFGGGFPYNKAITPGGVLVYRVAGSTGSRIEESAPLTTPAARVEAGGAYSPIDVLAATETRTLFQDAGGLVLQVKGTAGWTAGGPGGASFVSLTSGSAEAEMTDGGKIALADAVGQKLSYLDSAVTLTPTVIAETGMTVVNPDASSSQVWKIANLFAGGTVAPMVNESGLVVFGAEIAPDGTSDTRPALLLWSADTDQLSVILQVGQELEDGRTIVNIGLPQNPQSHSVWSDGLADDGTLGIDVAYTSAQAPDDWLGALLVTRVPEPSALLLMGFAAAGTLWRRPRRS